MTTPFALACCTSSAVFEHDSHQYRSVSSAERINVLRLPSSSHQALDSLKTGDFTSLLEWLIEEDLEAEDSDLCNGTYSAAWFMVSFKIEIKEAIEFRAVNMFLDMRWSWASSTALEFDEIIKQLLSIGRRPLSTYRKEQDCPFICMIRHWRDEKTITEASPALKTLVYAGVNLHHLSTHNVTPTVYALKQPYIFWHWCQLLFACGVDLENFVDVEMAADVILAHIGWTRDSLLELLTGYFEISTVKSIRCRSCHWYSDDLQWREYVESTMQRHELEFRHSASPADCPGRERRRNRC